MSSNFIVRQHDLLDSQRLLRRLVGQANVGQDHRLFKLGHAQVPHDVVEDARVNRAINLEVGRYRTALLGEVGKANKVGVVIAHENKPTVGE